MNWVLFNGSEFWVGPGVRSQDVEAATRIPECDALRWVADSPRSYDDGGFYPVAVDVGGGLITDETEEYL